MKWVWRKILLEKLIVFLLVKIFPVFYVTQSFIVVFTRARNLDCREPVESSTNSHFIFLYGAFSYPPIYAQFPRLSHSFRDYDWSFLCIFRASANVVRFVVLDLITQIIFGEWQESWSPSSCYSLFSAALRFQTLFKSICRLKSTPLCQRFTCMLDYGVLRFQFDGACPHMVWLASISGALSVIRSIDFFVFISHQQLLLLLLFWAWTLFYLRNFEAANVSLFRWIWRGFDNIWRSL
jgi:hypothetical protein